MRLSDAIHLSVIHSSFLSKYFGKNRRFTARNNGIRISLILNNNTFDFVFSGLALPPEIINWFIFHILCTAARHYSAVVWYKFLYNIINAGKPESTVSPKSYIRNANKKNNNICKRTVAGF